MYTWCVKLINIRINSSLHSYLLIHVHHWELGHVQTLTQFQLTSNGGQELTNTIYIQNTSLKHFPYPVKHTWFNTGSRFLNIYHTRNRLGCSKPNFNLFVEDDPFCTSKMRIIIFFICPKYNNHRQVLLNSESQITEPRSSYFLKGNYELSVNENVKLFNYVQTFMQETAHSLYDGWYWYCRNGS